MGFVCHSMGFVCHSMGFVCHSMGFVCHSMRFVCHSMGFVCHSMGFVCHSIGFVCHSMGFVCHSMGFVCHSIGFVCHSMGFVCYFGNHRRIKNKWIWSLLPMPLCLDIIFLPSGYIRGSFRDGLMGFSRACRGTCRKQGIGYPRPLLDWSREHFHPRSPVSVSLSGGVRKWSWGPNPRTPLEGGG